MTNSASATAPVSRPRAAVRVLVERAWFRHSIIGLIVFNAVILGLETYPAITREHGDLLAVVNGVVVAVFAVELALRLYAFGWRFFADGWNVFDFVVVVAALIPSGSASAALRLLRLLRVFRLLSVVRSMRVVVRALGAAMPGVLSMGGLLLMILYVFAIASTTLFASLDPENYGDLGRTFASLYRIVMGDGWGDVVVPLATGHPWVWAYFIVFSLIGAVVLLNLFVAVVVEAMNRIQTAELQQEEQSDAQRILDELRELRAQVARLETRGG
ncbi:ion transporter [Microbacterium sp. gxy059]|uniref:ion transporter n=1 Tax=Microbacterium sp. gxy059 TaxID=2957199 RepID=UPI003D99BFC2